MSNRNAILVIVGIIVVALICCLCLGVLGVGGLTLFNFRTVGSTTVPGGSPTQSFETPLPGPSQDLPTQVSPTQTPFVVRPTQSSAAQNTLNTLQKVVVPVSDLRNLAMQLKHIENIPVTETPPAAPARVGDQKTFWASDAEKNTNFKVDATLRYASDHLYFWIDNGTNFNAGALKRLGDAFEQKIYPTDREFFGTEWTPGVDDDPHLYILYTPGLGASTAGYYSSMDEYDPQVNQFSNSHEMFFVNSENQPLNDAYLYGVLAHEFQHMIHWYNDRNEETWMNEGFSDLAILLNGYDIGGVDYAYVQNPDLQLTDWTGDINVNGPHYGASFLYLDYLLNRVGDKVTKDVIANQQNGLESIDDTLVKDNVTDPQNGKPLNADDLFADWAVTNYLGDAKVADGRFAYKNYPAAPQAQATDSYDTCPVDTQTRDVHQYGVDYIRFACAGTHTLNFTGSTVVGLLAEKPHSGSYMFWSNKGDESDMTLSHSFDLTGKTGPIDLQYATWYDIEKDYDYLYVEAREKDGQWQILHTPSSTNTNPSGNSYGWGYTGLSDGWKQETVDLSQYAGKQVEVRFEYVTDPAVNGEGFLLDDVAIPQIGYKTDFEQDDGGWQPAGFVRVENALPQTYRLSLILHGKTTTVQSVQLS
ncbi:MAG: immune inhibitor A, partial [Anaerolineaceae bacterium]|nr:immune inhibitor A [Anaerolineaceae bacterium]